MGLDTKIPLFEASKDTGKFVAGILAHISKPSGERIFGATGWYTCTDMVSTIEKVSGEKVSYSAVPDEVFQSSLPPNIARELTETFMFMRDYAYFGPKAEEGLTQSLKVEFNP